MRPAPPLARVGLAVGGLLLAGTVGCGTSSAPPAAPTAVPGIVLLCVDTLRADAVDGSEAARAGMPVLNAFARTAASFSDASAAASWTEPSLAAVLSGLEVAHAGMGGPFGRVGALPASVTTLAETLRDRGWSTTAITSGGLFAGVCGFDQGFDAFRATFDERGPEAEILAWAAAKPAAAPFLLVLHTYAAHDPYGDKSARLPSDKILAPRREEDRRVLASVDLEAGTLRGETASWLAERFIFDRTDRIALEQAVGSARMPVAWRAFYDWLDVRAGTEPGFAALAERTRRAYRDGLPSVDAVVARTLGALDRAHVPLETVVAVVGDHGEGLGEHGTLLHGRWLHEEMLRVPVLLRAWGRVPAGARVRGSCGLVDLMPTLLDLAGVPAPAGIDGRSLLPLVRGAEGGHPVVAQVDRELLTPAPGRVLRCVSVRTAEAKWVLTFDLRTSAVVSESTFDLLHDPDEKQPLTAFAGAPERWGPEFGRAVDRTRREALGLTEGTTGAATER